MALSIHCIESFRSTSKAILSDFSTAVLKASSSFGLTDTYLCAIVPVDVSCFIDVVAASFDVAVTHHPT